MCVERVFVFFPAQIGWRSLGEASAGVGGPRQMQLGTLWRGLGEHQRGIGEATSDLGGAGPGIGSSPTGPADPRG